ncbi:ATP-binding protein [Novipirellula caenicola]|uniref:ATP-binding protein n=1 Tax=Novipirellula caenicola TaxID=1536901 RepID=UPI0031F040A5
MTEEDIRTKIVVNWLLGHGFEAGEFKLEYVFSVRIGRAEITTGRRTRTKSNSIANPRADVLVRRNNQNLLVVEVKAPSESVEDARDQGISYARLLDQIAPFVVVTDGTTSRIYDTVSKQEMSGESIPTDHPHVLNGFQVSADDLALKSEAMELFVSLSPDNLLEFCRHQIAARMQRLRGDSIHSSKKYIPCLYVARTKASDKLRELVSRRHEKVVVVTGRPQVGKTNFLCNFVSEEIDAGRPCLFFPSSSMISGLLNELAEDFGWSGFSTEASPAQLVRKLARVLKKSGQELTLVFDGWNETDIQEAAAIDKEVERISNDSARVTTVISFTNTSAGRLLQKRGNPTFVSEAARIGLGDLALIETNSPRVFEKSDWSAVYLENYDPEELQAAYRTYSKAFNVKNDSCPTSDPYLLAIATRHYQGGTLPSELDEQSLLENWLQSRIGRADIPGTNVQAALTELGSMMIHQGAPIDASEVKRGWGLPAISRIDPGFFDCALLSQYASEQVDFYFSRDRDFVISIWAAKWHARIEELLQSTTTFTLLTEGGQACIDAAIWFFSQREVQKHLAGDGTLPVFACADLHRLYLRGFAISLSRLKQSSSSGTFIGYDSNHWFEQFVTLFESGKDYDLRLEALRGALQLSDYVEMDSLPTMFLEESNDFDKFVRSILELDYESGDERVAGGIGVEFLSKLDYESRMGNEEETFISNSVRQVMTTANSRAEHLLASQAYASMCPKCFLRMLRGVPERNQKEDYSLSVACAVNAIEYQYYGTGMCPSYTDILKEDADLAEEEFNEIRELLDCVASSIWGETPVKNLRELLRIIGSFLPNDPERADTIIPTECPGQMRFGFTENN